MPALTASAILQERVANNPKLEIICGARVTSIEGERLVESITYRGTTGGTPKKIEVDGVLVQVGFEPNTDYLEGIVPLDEHNNIITNENMETAVPGILAAGDIRSGSPGQVSTAIGDGATAAIAAIRFLQEQSNG